VTEVGVTVAEEIELRAHSRTWARRSGDVGGDVQDRDRAVPPRQERRKALAAGLGPLTWRCLGADLKRPLRSIATA
jgi:hypothetical protein